MSVLISYDISLYRRIQERKNAVKNQYDNKHNALQTQVILPLLSS